MKFEKAYIPYGGYWSTPFSKWQMSFANLHAMRFAAEVGKRALAEKNINPEIFQDFVLGMTIPQLSSFYGAPWVAGMMGAPHLTGPTISQACATGTTCVMYASEMIDKGSDAALIVTCDRCSNGPHLYYPNPLGPGATGKAEDWVLDNFGNDPYARNAMIETAENVAREAGISREAQDEVALLRFQQYQDALKDDAAFMKRYMITPIEINPSGRKVVGTVSGDEGVFPTSKEGLAKLKPVMPNGTVTFGSQTHPADGNVGAMVMSRDKAREVSLNADIEIQVISYGYARAKKGFMPAANVPSSKQALEHAGISINDLKAVKTHNPFAVNDIYFSRQMEYPVEKMNNYGSSMVFGHPQGPTALRLIIELAEELALIGGGYGLFAGCAAGDSSAALVIKVN